MHLPHRPLLSLLLAMFLGALGCSALPTSDREIVTDNAPRDRAAAERLHRKGVKLVKDGELEKAEVAFHNALIADDSFGPAHNNIGLIYYGKGDLYSAAWSFEQAMLHLPARAEPANNLGMTLEAAGRYQEAIELFQSARALEPANPEFLGNLVRAKLRRGDQDLMLMDELQQLLFVEIRPEWRVFAQQQLVMLSRITESTVSDEFRAGGESSNVDEVEALPAPLSEPPLTAPGSGTLPLPSRGANIYFSDETEF